MGDPPAILLWFVVLIVAINILEITVKMIVWFWAKWRLRNER